MDALHQKYETLKDILRGYGSVAVAFSSGVDSTFLLKTVHDVLGDKAIAVTGCSLSFPPREQKEAAAFCKEHGIRQIVFDSGEIEDEAYRQNPKNRCYICKSTLFRKIIDIANENGIRVIAEGSNMDDNGDYRPGLMAIAELKIESPLRKAELYKEEIRALSKELGLPTWEKPSFACLASRFAYGETINEEKLQMVDKAEEYLMGLGIRQLRVRIHGEKDYIARIEVSPADFPVLLEDKTREKLTEAFKAYGFSYVTLDLLGYRTGSMNEVLSEAAKRDGSQAKAARFGEETASGGEENV